MGYFQLKGLFSKHETCSCRPAIFVHGRFDESTIFFDQWKLSKQTSYWSKTGFSFSVKNHNKFSSQNLVISSQNNVPKYRTRGHEQAYKVGNFLALGKNCKFLPRVFEILLLLGLYHSFSNSFPLISKICTVPT